MGKKQDDNRRVLFRYDASEHPLLDEWLANQSNKTQSIIHALEKNIAETGADQDLVKHTLRQATANLRVQTQPTQPMTVSDTGGREGDAETVVESESTGDDA